MFLCFSCSHISWIAGQTAKRKIFTSLEASGREIVFLTFMFEFNSLRTVSSLLLRPSPLLSFMINFALSSCSCSVSPFLLHTNGLYSLSAWEHKQHPIVYPGSRALADRGHLLLLSVSPPTKRILNNLQFFEPGEKEELRRGSREWNDLPLLSLSYHQHHHHHHCKNRKKCSRYRQQ